MSLVCEAQIGGDVDGFSACVSMATCHSASYLASLPFR